MAKKIRKPRKKRRTQRDILEAIEHQIRNIAIRLDVVEGNSAKVASHFK